MAYRAPNRGTPPTGIGGDTYDSSADKLFSNTFELFTYLKCDPETGILPDAIPVSRGGTGAITVEAARTSLGVYSVSEVNAKLEQVAQTAANDVAEASAKIKPITEGGTGANNAFNARSNLDVYSKSEVESLVATSGEGNVVGVAGGGTGATTVAEARTNLGVMSSTEVENAINSATPQSTETTFGVAKIATTAIAQAGTNDTDFITAKKLRDALNASGSAPVSACRAWLSVNTITSTILQSFNIASFVKTTTGQFEITFTTPMPHQNYVAFTNSIMVKGGATTSNTVGSTFNATQTNTVSRCYIWCWSTSNGSLLNPEVLNVGVFC